jgi:hypothetical protein
MNNIVGDIYSNMYPVGDILPLKELYIHNANNLKYMNIIPLLERTQLDILSLRINTDEHFSVLLPYNIKHIEIVNSKLEFNTILEYIQTIRDALFALELSINYTKKKANIILHYNNCKISFIIWGDIVHLIHGGIYSQNSDINLQRLLIACENISELGIYIDHYNAYLIDQLQLCNKPPKLNTLTIYYDDTTIVCKYDKINYYFQ